MSAPLGFCPPPAGTAILRLLEITTFGRDWNDLQESEQDMRRTFAMFVALVVGMLTVVRSEAQENKPLTEERVLDFVASMYDLEEWGDAHEEELDELDDTWDPDNMDDITAPFTSVVEYVKTQRWANEVNAIVRRHGFDDIEAWAVTGNRIMRAFAAIMYEESAAEIDEGMAEALKQIEESDMSAEQKAAMRDLLVSSKDMARMYEDVDERDKAALRPHIKEFEKMSADNDNDEYEYEYEDEDH